jgi:hypothetical protein
MSELKNAALFGDPALHPQRLGFMAVAVDVAQGSVSGHGALRGRSALAVGGGASQRSSRPKGPRDRSLVAGTLRCLPRAILLPARTCMPCWTDATAGA